MGSTTFKALEQYFYVGGGGKKNLAQSILSPRYLSEASNTKLLCFLLKFEVQPSSKQLLNGRAESESRVKRTKVRILETV